MIGLTTTKKYIYILFPNAGHCPGPCDKCTLTTRLRRPANTRQTLFGTFLWSMIWYSTTILWGLPLWWSPALLWRLPTSSGLWLLGVPTSSRLLLLWSTTPISVLLLFWYLVHRFMFCNAARQHYSCVQQLFVHITLLYHIVQWQIIFPKFFFQFYIPNTIRDV